MKITDKRENPYTYGGVEVMEVLPGKVLVVTGHLDAPDQIGKIIMRTNDNKRPFVSLEDGSLWGNSIENYRFKLIESAEVILK